MNGNNQFEFLDILAIIGFAIGWANYSENVSQSTMSEAIHSAVSEIHKHLDEQDEKINKILEVIKDEETS